MVPTWLLLKKGDTFTNQFFTSNLPNDCCFQAFGASADQPMVLSSYDPANPTVPNPGTGGVRPLIKTGTGMSGVQTQGGTLTRGGNNLAVVGLEFYAYKNDPSNPAFTGYNAASGLGFLNPVTWFLVEDCKFSFYTNGIDFSFPEPPINANNVIARRNVIVDNWGNGIQGGELPLASSLKKMSSITMAARVTRRVLK